jgi:hypothetical protein
MSEPLPPELALLVAAETHAPVTTRAAQAGVRARLGATLGIAAVATTTATTSTAAAATTTAATTTTVATATTATAVATVKTAVVLKLVGVALAVGTVATTVAVTYERSEPAPVTRSEPAPVVRRERVAPSPAPREPALVVEPIVEEPVDIAPAPPVPPPPPPPSSTTRPRAKPAPPAPAESAQDSAPAQPPPPSQSQLLADASRSLSLGDAARALELIDEDARVRSDGPLVEERDALRVSALSALGRTAEAQEAARRLLATYPHSIHRRLAERVLAKETP